MHITRTVYEKYKNGDSINDEELAIALHHFKRLQADLIVLGPIFRLAALEALDAELGLQSFYDARKRAKKEENDSK